MSIDYLLLFWAIFINSATGNLKELGEEITTLYESKLSKIEEYCKFSAFGFSDHDFNSKPSVLFLGTYSAGKTTTIEWLLDGKKYPGSNIGPEPTTDKFHIIMHGNQSTIYGSSLSQKGMQSFHALGTLEQNFVESPLLENLIIVDTPGALSSGHSNSYLDTCSWFAQRADLIVVMFSTDKVNIPSEMTSIIRSMHELGDKVVFLLNKADSVTESQLLRIYGAVMMGLGRIMTEGVEIIRLHVGSFRAVPCKRENYLCPIFEEEKANFTELIHSVHKKAGYRRLSDFAQRMQKLYIHMQIISGLYAESPSFFTIFKEHAYEQFLINLDQLIQSIALKNRIHKDDIPDVSLYRKILKHTKIDEFKYCTDVATVKDILKNGIEKLRSVLENGKPPTEEFSLTGFFTKEL